MCHKSTDMVAITEWVPPRLIPLPSPLRCHLVHSLPLSDKSLQGRLLFRNSFREEVCRALLVTHPTVISIPYFLAFNKALDSVGASQLNEHGGLGEGRGAETAREKPKSWLRRPLRKTGDTETTQPEPSGPA